MAQQYKVIITPFAELGLENIVKYIGENASTEVANKVLDGILEAIDDLSYMPQKNTIIPEISEQKIYRRILKWSYKIVYTIREEDILVVVVDIAHSKRDPQRLIDYFG
ncbi:MAG: type II toxin-antitoxin system RelE/ParE family toxin [Bacteroidota bacterium]